MTPEPSTWLATAIASLALLVSWRAFRVAKAGLGLKRPYPERRDYRARQIIRLAGPSAEDWEITSICMVWPPRAQFMTGTSTYDRGGSLISEQLSPSGRVLKSPACVLIPSAGPRRCWALASARSRTSRWYCAMWLISISQ